MVVLLVSSVGIAMILLYFKIKNLFCYKLRQVERPRVYEEIDLDTPTES